MKRDVASIAVSATISEAAALFVARHVGTLPVLDQAGRLVGILHLRDLLKLVMPDFVYLVDDFDYVREDFGLFETLRPSPATAAKPVSTIMEPAVSVNDTCGLLRAFAIINRRDLYDLPIVDQDNHLVGLASRVDIGTALLAGWQDED
jgi:CBS-domain-containing membrane protein